jgi:hypothetical protein
VSARVARALVAASLLGSACLGEESEPDRSDEASDAASTSCAGAPTITWETFGEGFMATHCQGCHASSAADRRDAPEPIVFDHEEDVLAMKKAILESAASDEPTMPPSGGTTEEERLRLRIWLRCFAD